TKALLQDGSPAMRRASDGATERWNKPSAPLLDSTCTGSRLIHDSAIRCSFAPGTGLPSGLTTRPLKVTASLTSVLSFVVCSAVPSVRAGDSELATAEVSIFSGVSA